MSQQRPFQHIQLRLIKDAPQKKQKPCNMAKNPQTQFYRNNRQEHARRLDAVGVAISEEWIQTRMQRQQDNLPDMPEALSLFLRIDPRELPIEDLRKYGIEVIGELEDGFIIGASSELSLITLRQKIEKFSLGTQHKVAGLWDIMDGVAWKCEKILSEALYREWPAIKDHDQMVVEIGVACLGTDEVPDHPKKRRSTYKSIEVYEKALKKWQAKQNEIYILWDGHMNQRYEQLLHIIESYLGEDLTGPIQENFDLESNLPDSFTVRVRISGKGFRDIVQNYPYVFDIVEAEGIEQFESIEAGNSFDNNDILIDPPENTAPAVCVIDSGIQERHIYLKEAIDGSVSRSWINSPTDVADYYHGGHGTRVAGAILFPREIPSYGHITPICWIQNARVLDSNNAMPNSLFQPTLMRQIVNHFLNSSRHTRIYNHSINSSNPCRIVHMSAWAATIDQSPKVSHILATIQKKFPSESTLLYRALLVQSARWPEWTERHPRPDNILRHIGYGIPDVSRATENTPYRITLITQGEVRISGKQVHIYEVRIPDELSSQGNQYDIRMDVTLSYKAQPRRTRRNRQRYLSTWLEWQTSRKHESMEHFLTRMIELASDDSLSTLEIQEENRETIKWMIDKQNNWGKIKGFKRDDNTVQKDWAHLKSYEWGKGFYIAVIGHIGWNRDMDATVPYALAVSFEAVNRDVEIYQAIAIENEVLVEVDVEI